MQKISDLKDSELALLIDNRWKSSDSVWDIITKTYETNLPIYSNEPAYLKDLPRRKSKVRANRIFVNMEAVINTLIANPPKPTMIPTRDDASAKDLASAKEKYFRIKYDERNIKEVVRKGLRNLYFSRLVVIKPFWDAKINDWNARALDPRKVRVSKKATKEDDSDFAIEQVDDTYPALLARFPAKQAEILQHGGYALGADGKIPADVMIENKEVTYQEAWIRDTLACKLGSVILSKGPNPYFDFEGILLTDEEQRSLDDAKKPEERRAIMQAVKAQQDQRLAAQNQQQNTAQQSQPTATPAPEEQGNVPQPEGSENPITYRAYYFNHFDQPRKPYIFATVFNSENSPIGHTDMITQAAPLQENVDATKRDITANAKLVNGKWVIDSTVMDQAEAQRVADGEEVGGVVFGKNVAKGVRRETGTPLPAFVIENMKHSEEAIDNIMAASSAFRGQREGTETKGGRLALVDQSYLRLNELVQVTDYLHYELFNWFYQLSKLRYTEHHYAKTLGKDQATQIITLTQDDFEDGEEVRVIPGKMLPEDREFRYEQAQKDVAEGIISPLDYLEIAGYNSPKELAKNAFMFKVAPMLAVGLTDEERKQIPPPIPMSQLREQIAFDDLPTAAKVQFLARMGITITEEQAGVSGAESIAVAFKDMTPDAQVQLLAKLGIKADPHMVVAKHIADAAHRNVETAVKIQPPEKPKPLAK